MTLRETGGLAGKGRAVLLADADKTDASGIATVLVSRTGMLLPGRTVKATGWGAGALTTQQSLLSFPLGDGVGVCLQQLCCWGMVAAMEATTGAMSRSISIALTARKYIDFNIRQILQRNSDHASVTAVTGTKAVRTHEAWFLTRGIH